MTEQAFDLYEDLSKYDTIALRAKVRSINAAVDPHMQTGGAGLSDGGKRKILSWIEEAQRISAEVVRRERAPSPGPGIVCYEVMPDGSGYVRLHTPILAF